MTAPRVQGFNPADLWESLVDSGMSEADATAEVQRRMQGSERPDFSNVESGSASVGLGRRPGRKALGALAQVGQNWADESLGLLAAANTLRMTGGGAGGLSRAKDQYRKVSGAVEEAATDFQRTNPKTALGISLASAAVPVAGGLKLANMGGRLARVASSAPMIGLAAGAASGAGAGHGSERIGNALVGGGIGAAGGAVLGAAAPHIARGLTKVASTRPAQSAVNVVRQVLAKRGGASGAVAPALSGAVDENTEAALRVIAEKFADDGIPPDRIQAALTNARNGDPELLLNLGGENVQALARVVQSIPGRGKQVVQSALDEQAVAVPELVTQGVERAIGRKIPNAQTRIQELAGEAAAAAKPGYTATRGTIVPDGEDLADLLSRPALGGTGGHHGSGGALKKAQLHILNRGKKLPEADAWRVKASQIVDESGQPMQVGEKVKKRVITVGMLDDAKKVLDARIDAIRDKIEKGVASGDDINDKLDYENIVDAIKRVADKADPRYAEARGVAEKGIRKREAFRSGTGALTRRADDLEAELAGMSADERARMLEGAATDLEERVTSRNPTNAAGVFDPKARRNLDKITAGTPAQQAVRETFERANKINQQARASTMRGQSTTASTLRGQVDLEDKVAPVGALEKGLEIGGRVVRGNWAGIVADAIRTANARYRRGVTSDVAAEVARVLTMKMGDNVSRAEAARIMRQAMTNEMVKRAAASGRRVGAGAAAGTAGGSSRP